MSFVLGTLLLAMVTAAACALPGCFIVLRKNSMLVDAIGHAVLPGIVLGYFLTRDLASPVLMVGAALAGLSVVLANGWLERTGLITGDASQGLVFPALFSVGVIMINLNFANLHLDTHAVLVGDLNLAAFAQIELVPGVQVSTYLLVMVAMLIINAVFVAITFPLLKITTFDPQLATTLGLPVRAINLGFMGLVSLTVTVAFNAAGAILVVALMVIPAATAYLLTERLPAMIGVALGVAVCGAFVGFWLAYHLDAATSAGMAVFYGAVFMGALAATRFRQWRRARTQPS